MNGIRFAATAAALVVFPIALAGALALYAIDQVIRRDEDLRLLDVADEAESWLHALYEGEPA